MARTNRNGLHQAGTLLKESPATDAVDLDRIMARLDALEEKNEELEHENKQLKASAGRTVREPIRLSGPNKQGEVKPLIVLDHGQKGWPVTVSPRVAAWMVDHADDIATFLQDEDVRAELKDRGGILP